MGGVGKGGGEGTVRPFDAEYDVIVIITITLFKHGKNNRAKYTVCNILKMFTNYRINGNSLYKDEC